MGLSVRPTGTRVLLWLVAATVITAGANMFTQPGEAVRRSGTMASSQLGSYSVLQSGTSESGQNWTTRYREVDGESCLQLIVDGAELQDACGFDIPNTTEIGFSGGLRPGEGNFYLYGITSSRITTIVARSKAGNSKVETQSFESSIASGNLRHFVIVREPIDDVDALIGFDSRGEVVQEIGLPGGSESQS